MRPMRFFLAAIAFAFSVSANAADDSGRLKYAVLYSDANDVTHFRDEYLPWQPSQTSATFLTPFLDAEKIGFLRLPRGLNRDWHPAPGKRFVMTLSGVMEVVAGDGEPRIFRPGSVLLVTDTKGRGHITNVLGDEEVLAVWVPVP